MAILRWYGGLDPFGGMRYLQREMERLVGRVLGGSQRLGGEAFPPVNVLNGENDIVVQCEVPGVKKEAIDLSITGDTLVVKGEKAAPAEENDVAYQLRERGVGQFSRTVVLPDRVDADKVSAAMESGILTVRLPKSEAAKPRQIDIS